MRGATLYLLVLGVSYKFQSTLLMRGATQVQGHCRRDCTYFNPRSSCEERRGLSSRSRYKSSYFNPRSSCEERQCMQINASGSTAFQSTLLMRGATALWILACTVVAFQSTLLMRGATNVGDNAETAISFQSTLLMRGATCIRRPAERPRPYFNPRSSCEERP